MIKIGEVPLVRFNDFPPDCQCVSVLMSNINCPEHQISVETVTQMVKAVELGYRLAPVKLSLTEENVYLLISGREQFEACELLGLKQIKAEILQT